MARITSCWPGLVNTRFKFFTFTTLQTSILGKSTLGCYRCASSLSSSDKRSHYEILGLPHKSSSTSEIKARYYELAKKYHPDRNRAGSSEDRRGAAKKYARIKEAYEVLGNTEKKTAFDMELSGRDGTEYQTQRNARSNDHYYGHTRYSGTQHQASSLHRKPRAYYNTKHQDYSNTKRSTQNHATTDGDPLRPRPQMGSNYDVPHFDFDKHYHQQRSYDNHRKIQIIKMAQRRFQQDLDTTTFETDQEFIHHHHNPYSKPSKPVIALTGPGLVVLGSCTIWLFYLVAKYLF